MYAGFLPLRRKDYWAYVCCIWKFKASRLTLDLSWGSAPSCSKILTQLRRLFAVATIRAVIPSWKYKRLSVKFQSLGLQYCSRVSKITKTRKKLPTPDRRNIFWKGYVYRRVPKNISFKVKISIIKLGGFVNLFHFTALQECHIFILPFLDITQGYTLFEKYRTTSISAHAYY